jgi:aryl-alcohol dehydrogenase-like predicted oxidoreductase
MTLRVGDIQVARMGLGTNRLRNLPENVALMKEAAAGVGLVDTAHTYTGGESETTIGTTLSPVPDGCLVGTKGGRDGASPQVLGTEIETSLRRLRTDSIALYYLHRVDPATPLEESLAAIREFQGRGWIRHVGVSNVEIEQIERARAVVPVVAVQNRYSLVDRTNDDVVDYCAREGIVFVAYFPLRGVGGPTLSEIAERRGATPQQIALAWLLRRSPTLLPIPGTLSIEHLKDNLGALEIELSDDEYDALLQGN